MSLDISHRSAIYLVMNLVSFISLLISAKSANCPYPGWSSHQLKVYETYGYSLINASTPGLFVNESKYGVEGGQIIFINDTFYLFITEFTGDPLFVPSNLALWSISLKDFQSNNVEWTRLKTLYKSGGTCDCNSTRASLGSSITAAYNDTSSKWMLYYVGFISCNNDTHFVNRDGRIFLAESTVSGINGIIGPYKDIDVILSPNGSQSWWEGHGDVKSFSNPWKINDSTYYAFYGGVSNGTATAYVGLVESDSLYGAWQRLPTNPVHLINPNGFVEQPIIYKYSDNSFGAFFDSLDNEKYGDIAYNWSPDGINWNENCFQLLNVVHWGGGGRTPQGLVPINDTHFYLFFSGYQPSQGQRFESFGMTKVAFI